MDIYTIQGEIKLTKSGKLQNIPHLRLHRSCQSTWQGHKGNANTTFFNINYQCLFVTQ